MLNQLNLNNNFSIFKVAYNFTNLKIIFINQRRLYKTLKAILSGHHATIYLKQTGKTKTRYVTTDLN